MANTLAHRWWILALRGGAAIVFGILTLVWPLASLYALVVLFGAYALVDGAFNLAFAVRGRRRGVRPWGSLVAQGLLGVVAGVLTLAWPGISALVLLMIIATWAVVTGVVAVAAAVRLRRQITGEWLLALSGVLSMAFGLLLFLFPGAGALAVAMWIGAYALALGVILTWLAFRLRAWARVATPRSVPMPGTHRPVSPPAPA
jgi:uncharacterized membrane protein HdeD (DUF308 family)